MITMPAASYSIPYGKERITFQLIRRPRKTLAITVHPDLSVEVVAPEDAGEEAILQRVTRRARWIRKQQRQFLQWKPRPKERRYRSGETHRYLGRQYRLKIIESPERSVKLRGAFLEVEVPYPTDREAVKDAVAQWYREHAQVRFEKQLKEAHARMRAYEIPEPKLRLRHMTKRWGSCTASGEIILNPDLIKAPTPCIEYVIIHELCHLKYHNHTRVFFRLLETVLPNWREHKHRLERFEQ